MQAVRQVRVAAQDGAAVTATLLERSLTVPCPHCDACVGGFCAYRIGKDTRATRAHLQRLEYYLGQNHDHGDEDRWYQ